MNFNYNVLVQLLADRKIRHCEFAKACNSMSPTTMSAILGGWLQPGKKRLIDIISGLESLNFKQTEINSVISQKQKHA